MSNIRRQSIISSVVVYVGFALGLLNTYLFTRQGGFSKEQYGLTGTFIAISNIMFSVASLGMPSYIGKFFPYYKAHLDDKKNDQLTWALLIPCLGFFVVVLLGIAFKHILIDKIFNNSPQLVYYYYWVFPFGFGYTIYMILEAYAWQQRKAVLSTLLREVIFRVFVTVLIVLTTIGLIHTFNTFIGLYSFAYLFIILILVVYFRSQRKLTITLSVSRVSRKFFKKILALIAWVWGGSLVFNIASVFGTIVIAAVLPNGMAAAAIYTLAQNISSLIQAPQRAVISSSIGPLSQAWKDKNYKKINQVYHSSSINQLIFSCAMFCLIWLNFEDGIYTFHIQGDYIPAKIIFLYIGLTRILDMGTGVNAQIIATSTFWRFELISGLILITITLPLNYEFTRYLGAVGPALSDLITFAIYNFIRFMFLWNKFKMQPFTIKTLYTIVLAAFSYFVAYYIFKNNQGIVWIILRSSVFIIVYALGMFLLKLSPDALPVLNTIKKRLRLA